MLLVSKERGDIGFCTLSGVIDVCVLRPRTMGPGGAPAGWTAVSRDLRGGIGGEPERQAERETEREFSRGDFVILLGLISAGVGMVFLLFYVLVAIVWGAYLGVNAGLGVNAAMLILLLGLAVATLVWIGREIVATVRPRVGRLTDR